MYLQGLCGVSGCTQTAEHTRLAQKLTSTFQDAETI